MPDIEQIMRKIEENRQRMIDLQADLTAVPALAPENGGEGEWAKAQVLLSWLPRLGIGQVDLLPAPDERVPGGRRPNLVATIPGRSPAPAFWIMTHLDVVPPGERSLWASDPFRMEIQGERLVGRGVEDNQQSMTASIFAAASILELGLAPAGPVRLLFVADEETGSQYGIQYLLANHRLFAPGDLILVPDSGSPEGADVQIAEKGVLWLRFRTRGKQCHAARPQEGINAFVAGSELVVALDELNRSHAERDGLFQPPDSTFTPTRKEANVPNVNTLPGEDVFYLDCRILPGLDAEAVLQEIAAIARRIEGRRGVSIEIGTVHRVSSPPTRRDAPLVGRLKQAIREVYGIEGREVGAGGGTVGAFLRQAGYDTVVWSRIERTAHMPNERCLIAYMVGDAQVMARVMMMDR